MKNIIKRTKEALIEVHKNKSYLISSLIFAFLVFAFNVLINNYRILISNFTLKLFFSLLVGTIYVMSITSFILLIVMSLLSGIVFSMSIFLVKRQITSNIGASSSTLLVSLIAPACPSCAIGLLSTLGFGSFLAVLPFKGLELGVFGVILLGISVVYLSNKIVTKTCDINSNTGGKKKWKIFQ
ncbi:hypothetical protein HQ489_06085 [Candidatus Woesearchaeota archaeon]|nr:hypothetical protein [Candidatus Woesearchaeota archaeon]